MLFEDDMSDAFELRFPSCSLSCCDGLRNGWAMSMMVSVSVDGRSLRAVSGSIILLWCFAILIDTRGSLLYLGVTLVNGVLIFARHRTDRLETSLFTPRVLHVKVRGRPASSVLACPLSSFGIVTVGFTAL